MVYFSVSVKITVILHAEGNSSFAVGHEVGDMFYLNYSLHLADFFFKSERHTIGDRVNYKEL